VLTRPSFFPQVFRLQEHLFFILFAVALILAWFEKSRMWIRTPFDMPLLCFVGWVLCTVPFAADPNYSFSEWRKVVAHILVFYWAMYLLRGLGACPSNAPLLTGQPERTVVSRAHG
jgi:glucan phosphoethanolaminetransferase (alkaline phosphatase superfamily)